MKFILIVFGILSTRIIMAQTEPPHPKFSNFRGGAYKLEVIEVENSRGVKRKMLKEKYGDFVYDYPKIGFVDIPNLNIALSDSDEVKFPGIDRSTSFCMVLHSTMTITTKGCYEFSLNSDDGSILWINDEMVVDNDGGHQMRKRLDSLVYDPGTYNVKVWYFQSLPDKFGIILDAKIVGKAEVCPTKIRTNIKPVLNFESTVFFDIGSAVLKSEAIKEIENIAKSINIQKVKSISIIGHTDDQGITENNLVLSLRRAESIGKALRSYLQEDIIINTQGLGESTPMHSNDTKKGQAKNRRVEIILEY